MSLQSAISYRPTRPGGRVLTLREPFADGLHAEAGGMAISARYRASRFTAL